MKNTNGRLLIINTKLAVTLLETNNIILDGMLSSDIEIPLFFVEEIQSMIDRNLDCIKHIS